MFLYFSLFFFFKQLCNKDEKKNFEGLHPSKDQGWALRKLNETPVL